MNRRPGVGSDMRSRRFQLPLMLAVSLLAAGCYKPPATNALAGKSETEVVAGLGKPRTERGAREQNDSTRPV